MKQTLATEVTILYKTNPPGKYVLLELLFGNFCMHLVYVISEILFTGELFGALAASVIMRLHSHVLLQ